MDEYVYNLYESIIQNSDSILIIFMIVLTLAIVVAIIPLYSQITKGRKVDKEHERAREQQIIEVVKENTSVIAGLRATLDSSGAATVKAVDRIHDRIDANVQTSTEIKTDVAQINTKLAVSLENQREMAAKINKILINTSGEDERQ